MCRRAVRVRSQLTSHKRFATAFKTYCNIVDNARLYLTNDLDGPPKVYIVFYLLFLLFKRLFDNRRNGLVKRLIISNSFSSQSIWY